MGTDAADVRRRRRTAPPRSACCSRAAPTPTITTKTIDIAQAVALDRAAGERQRKVLEAAVPRDSSRRRARCRRRSKRRASCSRPARFRRPIRDGAGRGGRGATGAANNFNPEEINPPVVDQGRHDRAAARGAAGPPRGGARAARRRRADRPGRRRRRAPARC